MVRSGPVSTALLMLFLFATYGTALAEPIKLRDYKYFISTTDIELKKALDRFRANEAVIEGKGTPNLAYQKHYVWVYFNQSITAVDYLSMSYPLDHFEFVLLKDGEPLVHETLGEKSKQRRPYILNRRTLVPLMDFPTDGAIELLVKIKSDTSIIVPIELWAASDLLTEVSTENLILGAYFGFLLLAFCVGLVAFTLTRERLFLAFAFFLGMHTLLQIAVNGLLVYTDFLGTRFSLKTITYVSPFVIMAMVFLTGQVLSGIAKNYRIALYVASLMLLCVCVFSDYQLAIKITLITNVIAILALLLYVGSRAVKKMPGARLYFVSWLVYATGLILIAMKSFGFLPHNFYTNYSMQIGVMMQAVFLGISIGTRYNQLQLKKEQAVGPRIPENTTYQGFAAVL